MPTRRPALDVARLRLANERLIGPRFASAVEAVAWLGAVQAQDYAGAKWGLAQRCAGETDATIDAALDRGAILRTHVLRPTWHLVVPEDLRWMLALSAERVKRFMAPYDRKLELDARTLGRATKLIVRALEGGRAATRTELAAALAAGGIVARGQRLAHVVAHAELDAVICSGPTRGKQQTYALVDERVPPTAAVPRDEALARLALRYVRSHGPAQVADLAWWGGVTIGEARAAIDAVASSLSSATVDGKTWWFADGPPPPRRRGPLVHLLPNYDEYVIGFRDHSPVYDPARFAGADAANLLGVHLVVVDGAVLGGWRRTVTRRAVAVRAEVVTTLAPPVRAALDRAAADYGRFLGLPATLTVARARTIVRGRGR